MALPRSHSFGRTRRDRRSGALNSLLFRLLASAALGMSTGAVALPSDFGWSPAWGVTRTGVGSYTITGTPEALLPTGTVLDVYVAPNGLEANDGLSPASPTVPNKAALLTGAGYDVVRINYAGGTYWGDKGHVTGRPNGSGKHIVQRKINPGDTVTIVASGYPYGTGAAHYNAAPTWTLVRGTPGVNAVYSSPIATTASAASMPIDFSPAARATTPNGEAVGPTRVLSLAALTESNMAFSDPAGGLIYFRPFDDRDIRQDQLVSKGGCNGDINTYAWGFNATVDGSQANGRVFHFTGLTYIGGSACIGGNMQNVLMPNAPRAMLVLSGCGLFGAVANALGMNGGYDVYAHRSYVGFSGADAWNVHAYGGSNTNVDAMSARMFLFESHAEVFCGYDYGSRNNAFTLHEQCVGIAVGCRFANSEGRVFGIVDRSRALVFGGSVSASASIDPAWRTMVSASGSTVIDLYETSFFGAARDAGQAPDFRAEPGARVRYHGTLVGLLQLARFVLDGSSSMLEEDATSLLSPTPGALRLHRSHARIGSVRRLYVLGVWGSTDAAKLANFSAALAVPANGTVTAGSDSRGVYVDVVLAPTSAANPALTLTHAPEGGSTWTQNVTLLTGVADAPAFISDDFSSLADNGALAGRTPVIGANWTTATANIRGQGGRVWGGAAARGTIPTNAGTRDMSVRAQLTFLSATAAYVCARWGGSSNHYLGGWDEAAQAWIIARDVAGTTTILNTGAAYAPAAGDARNVELVAYGSTLFLFVEGVLVAKAADATFGAQQGAGVRFGPTAGSATTGCHIDNLQAIALS